jgi:hypothetical protein
MRHLTELLATNSVPGEERKAQYYALLARETERLHRMVDSLEARPTGRSRLAYSLPTDPRGFFRNPQSRHFQVAHPYISPLAGIPANADTILLGLPKPG